VRTTIFLHSPLKGNETKVVSGGSSRIFMRKALVVNHRSVYV